MSPLQRYRRRLAFAAVALAGAAAAVASGWPAQQVLLAVATCAAMVVLLRPWDRPR